jgi:hypothetical protein
MNESMRDDPRERERSMNRLRSTRMRWLAATFASIVGMAAVLRWGAAQVGAVPPRPKDVATANGWLVVDGVAYRPTREFDHQNFHFGQTCRANVEARDPGSGDLLWMVTVREGGIGPNMLDMTDVSPDLSPDLFALRISARGRGIAAETPDGGVYLLDPQTRRVRRLKAPSPPKRPVLDARLPGKTRCEVHDRVLLEDVVPIRYGLYLLDALLYEVRSTRFPYASPSFAGGCVVGPSREARVLYCTECRAAEWEWGTASAADGETDEDRLSGVD